MNKRRIHYLNAAKNAWKISRWFFVFVIFVGLILGFFLQDIFASLLSALLITVGLLLLNTGIPFFVVAFLAYAVPQKETEENQ